MIAKVKVITSAKRNEITKVNERDYKAKLTAQPIDAKANKALVQILSKHFKVAKSLIRIIQGISSKNKLIEIS